MTQIVNLPALSHKLLRHHSTSLTFFLLLFRLDSLFSSLLILCSSSRLCDWAYLAEFLVTWAHSGPFIISPSTLLGKQWIIGKRCQHSVICSSSTMWSCWGVSWLLMRQKRNNGQATRTLIKYLLRALESLWNHLPAPEGDPGTNRTWAEKSKGAEYNPITDPA